MSLMLGPVSFETPSAGVNSAVTQDRQTLSILFDDLTAQSQPTDKDAARQVGRAEGVIACTGEGWATVQVRGAARVDGDHGYAHVLGWVNGRRLRATPGESDEPLVAATTARVRDGQLRISLLLLAQRDLAKENTAAACWIDSIDVVVVKRQR